MNIFGILIGLLVLTILVVLHEFGHYLAAVKNGVKVNEFGIGFPPRAIAWIRKDGKWHRLKKSDYQKTQKTLIFSLNWLPIGGFCSMDGESAADTRKHTFGAASFWQKTKILFGGVFMNWLTAFVILTVLALTGMPKLTEDSPFLPIDHHISPGKVLVAKVEPNSPAATAGFLPQDELILASDTKISSPEDLTNFNRSNAGQTVHYQVKRHTETKVLTATLNPKDANYLLGVSMAVTPEIGRATWSAPLVGAISTVQLTGETFKGFGKLLASLFSGLIHQFNPDENVRKTGGQELKRAGDSLTGPIGIIGGIFPAFTSQGPTAVLFLAAVISISLACMNILPIPALDGGRWLLIAIYRLRRKTLSKETEARIVSRAFLTLIGLIIFITVLDIIKFF